MNLDIVGKKFGKLTVLSFHCIKNRNSFFKCVCDCGKECYKYGCLIKRGQNSCGCAGKELQKKSATTHGDYKKRLYSIHKSMLDRCSNPKSTSFKHYGGRGITVCKDWNNYLSFRDWSLKNGYEESLTLDRINVNGNYEPSNCRWTNWDVQGNNRRSCHYLTYNNETLTIMQWYRKTGIPRTTILRRIELGWSIHDTLTVRPAVEIGSITYKGQTLPLHEWARRTGIPKATLWARIHKYNMPLEKAMKKSVRKIRIK